MTSRVPGAVLALLLVFGARARAAPAIALDPSSGVVEVRDLSSETLEELARLEGFESWSRVLRVDVEPPRDGQPPVLGSYHIDGNVVRFRPMFPFDPGRSYRVTLALSDDPRSAVVSLPAVDREPTTRVSEIYPTASVLPENQLKLYIYFSAPMSGGDGLPFVRLLDERGEEVVDPFLPLGAEFWDRERRRYTVFFDPGRVKRDILPNQQMGRPIREGERYVLAISSEWRDERGAPLAEEYRKEFVAGPPDEIPLDPASWKILAPRAGTRDPLVVDFPEAIDRGLLDHALGVESVDGVVEVSRNETRWSYVPEEPWRPGRHELVALAILEDLAGNQIGTPFEVDRFDRIERPEDQEVYRISFVIRD